MTVFGPPASAAAFRQYSRLLLSEKYQSDALDVPSDDPRASEAARLLPRRLGPFPARFPPPDLPRPRRRPAPSSSLTSAESSPSPNDRLVAAVACPPSMQVIVGNASDERRPSTSAAMVSSSFRPHPLNTGRTREYAKRMRSSGTSRTSYPGFCIGTNHTGVGGGGLTGPMASVPKVTRTAHESCVLGN